MECLILMNGLWLNILVNKNTFYFFINIVILLVKIKLDGHELPTVLPEHLVPPSKRHLNNNNNTTPYGNSGIYPTINNSGYN